jgi:hypothetical protein
MSGFYNVWPKVLNPNKELLQMTSDSFKTPFYFGGSQVPDYLKKQIERERLPTVKRSKIYGKSVRKVNNNYLHLSVK